MKLLPLLLIAVVVVAIVAEDRSYRKPHTKRPPHRHTRRPRTGGDPNSQNLCKQSFLSRLNPTQSCKKGCLISCGSRSTNTVARCERCRDKCCEATCQSWDCIPVSQIGDIVNMALDVYDRLSDRSMDLEETNVEETTVAAATT